MKTDNELIAEFMRFEIIAENQIVKGVIIPDRVWKRSPEVGFPYYGGFRSEQMRFNESWDWLMPVVEKIADLHNAKFEYDVDKIAKGDWPKDNDYMEVIALPLATPIKEAYEKVVEFIKWYNEQKFQEEIKGVF